MVKWNLDQAWAWFVLRDEEVVATFSNYTITAYNWYKPENERLTVENGSEFCAAIAKGKVTAWIGKTRIPQDDWNHYKIETFERRRSWITDGVDNVEGVTFFADDAMKAFPKEPITKDFSGLKSSKDHEIAYEEYLFEQIVIYLQDKNLKRPYESWAKEEPILRERMGSGCNRDKFKSARIKAIKKFPHHNKKNLSHDECAELRGFITTHYSKTEF